MDKELPIQQVAAKTGLSIHTLRYYERLGLMASIHRLPNGHRRYSKGDLEWIDFLKCLRSTAMPVAKTFFFLLTISTCNLQLHIRTLLWKRKLHYKTSEG